MPGMPRPVADERDALLTFLAHQRYLLRVAAHGLTDTQAATAPSASTLSVGGLIKHVAQVEQGWIDTMLQVERPVGEEAARGYVDGFRLLPGETLADALRALDAAAARTEEVVAGFDDLDAPVPVPKGVPWFPMEVEAWSVRWVLLHLIEEVARHAGHADILRESLDGATAIPLMAAVEGWAATPWVTPWARRDAEVPVSS